ncbi:SGNH/GDSL hydrolase family protein [Mariprofundus ferrooxydans]|uniref:SGNH/GDSL hydrolase family protein n=1 Tax=Mariprofundus ferrooxydans TaxID=314344 RepID=UPI0014307947|nr:SGNH/GDSL hydrolase family protein [Mariprofundus ferrooxydans]
MKPIKRKQGSDGRGLRESLFERHPKVTCVTLLFIELLIVIQIAEYILAIKQELPNNTHYDNPGISRFIILREGFPNSAGYQVPPENYILRSDNLPARKFAVSFDSNGFMEPSGSHDHPDSSVFFLGGSTTECLFVSEKNRFPYLSGRILEEKTGARINAYNAGRSDNNSAHSINILLNKILPMRPNIVVLMHNINDLDTLSVQNGYWDNQGLFPMIYVHQQQKSRSPLYNIMKGVKDLICPNIYASLKSMISSPHESASRPASERRRTVELASAYVSQFESNLNIFISICRYKGITPVLMTQASRLKKSPSRSVSQYYRELYDFYGIPFTYEQLRQLHQKFNESVRNVGRSNNVLVIDLDRGIPHNKTYMYDMVHLTDQGSFLAAQIIAKQLSTIVHE